MATKAFEIVTKLLSDYLSFTKYTIAALTIWGLIYAVHELVKGDSKNCDRKLIWTMYVCGVCLALFAACMNFKVDYEETKQEKLNERMWNQRAHEHHKDLRNIAQERLEEKMEHYLKGEEGLEAVQVQKEVTELLQKISKEHPAEDMVKCRCGLGFTRFFGALSLVWLAVHASSFKWFFNLEAEENGGEKPKEGDCGFPKHTRRDITIILLITAIISNILSLSWKIMCKENSEANGPSGAPANGPPGAPANGPPGASANGPPGASANGPPGAPANGQSGAPANGQSGAPASGPPGAQQAPVHRPPSPNRGHLTESSV